MALALEAKIRNKSEKPYKLRGREIVPGVIYGGGAEPKPIAISLKIFKKVYSEAGESSIIDLIIGEESPVKALIQDIQREPVTGEITHFDLMRIDMSKVMHATIPLNFVGEAPVVKEAGGTLVKNLTEVKARCLPKDLVSGIPVDLSVLKTFADVIHIKDLKIPQGITIENQQDDLVVKAVEHKEEVIEKGPATVADIEVVGKKKEGEEGALGEAGTGGATQAVQGAQSGAKAGGAGGAQAQKGASEKKQGEKK